MKTFVFLLSLLFVAAIAEPHILTMEIFGMIETPEIKLNNDETLHILMKQSEKKVFIRIYLDGKEIFDNEKEGNFEDINQTFTDAGKYTILFINTDPVKEHSVEYIIKITKGDFYERGIIFG